MKDHYVALGIPASATAEEIRRAFRRLAALNHPDRNPDASAGARFIEARKAYEILSNPDARAHYDQLRQTHLVDDPRQVAIAIWTSYLDNLV